MNDYNESMARFEAMRQNGGEDPHEIDEERFFHLLEVLPPAEIGRAHV